MIPSLTGVSATGRPCAALRPDGFYREMPDSLVYAALKKLPDWMIVVNERFDKRING